MTSVYDTYKVRQVDAIGADISGLSAPASDAVAVTPSDSTVLTTTRGLYVGGAGNVTVIMLGGETVTFTAVPAGTLLPVRVTKVKSTSTTATAIVALW